LNSTERDALYKDARCRIGYQCMVDSFAIGSGSISNKASLYQTDVYGKQPQQLNWSDECDDYCYGFRFYGGDLNGVSNAVQDYLAGLGVNLLYLTPIFKAHSNHKYDTLDYKTIDPQFGALQDFQLLADKCHELNIKLILDGVFNHTSCNHEWFIKAKQGIAPFTGYYKKNEADYYLYWAGIDTLPLLDHTHPDVKNAFYHGKDSIVAHWLKQGADGWRLDVAEGLGKEVIRDIKAAMRKQFNDKLLYGEIIETWGKDWLGDDKLDGLMNYVFLGTTANFLTGKISAETYLGELDKMYREYPKVQLYNSWNIISTHDTNRMLYEVDGNENLFKMAVTLQFTYPGMPMIYYGDELGLLPGQRDVSNRRGMDWQRVDLLKLKAHEPWKHIQAMDWNKVNRYSSFHFFYKHLLWLRKQYLVFTNGEFIPLFANKSAIAFMRKLDDKLALVLINKGEAQQLTIPIPAEIARQKLVLQGVHGPLPHLHLSQDTVTIGAFSQNTYIFVN